MGASHCLGNCRVIFTLFTPRHCVSSMMHEHQPTTLHPISKTLYLIPSNHNARQFSRRTNDRKPMIAGQEFPKTLYAPSNLFASFCHFSFSTTTLNSRLAFLGLFLHYFLRSREDPTLKGGLVPTTFKSHTTPRLWRCSQLRM